MKTHSHSILLTLFLLGLTSLGMSGEAYAQQQEPTPDARKAYTPPYGMAGCGIGHNWFPNRNGPQLGLWGIRFLLQNGPLGIGFSQTWYISSGTSGCRETRQVASAEREVFIDHNIADLTREASQGQGEALFALASLYGCNNDSAKQAFALFAQSNSDVFRSASIEPLLTQRVQLDTALSKACTRA